MHETPDAILRDSFDGVNKILMIIINMYNSYLFMKYLKKKEIISSVKLFPIVFVQT